MGASRIQGITVEIGGDTTKLTAALKGVNGEIRTTQSQLRDVERLLKLDPGNTELLAQKHRLLAEAVRETKEKLETLKAAAEQANEALAKGEITQEQYDGLQREIIETEEKLKSLEQQANQSAVAVQKIAAVGEDLKNLGDKISGVGTTLTKTVTTPIVGLGTVAVKTAADFDTAMSQVGAVSGATGKDLDALRDKAREMGSKTKFSASEAAEAMNYMAMAGWKTSDMLSGIEGIMNLAAASGEDLASTSDIVTDALTAFGLTAADSGHFADILAAASSNANTNVSMMGETFKYCAPIAGALGFSAEDTAEAIGLMGNAGIKSTQAGTALRTIMSNLSGEVKICGNSIGEVTIATTNADGSMRDFFSNIWNAITGAAQSIWNGLKDFFSGLWEGIKNIFQTVLDVIKTLIVARFEFYKLIITTVLNVIQTVVSTVWNAIKSVIETVTNAIGSFLSSAWEPGCFTRMFPATAGRSPSAGKSIHTNTLMPMRM